MVELQDSLIHNKTKKKILSDNRIDLLIYLIHWETGLAVCVAMKLQKFKHIYYY